MVEERRKRDKKGPIRRIWRKKLLLISQHLGYFGDLSVGTVGSEWGLGPDS
jgi:hypothetical protein